jgi:hypothetical protein
MTQPFDRFFELSLNNRTREEFRAQQIIVAAGIDQNFK